MLQGSLYQPWLFTRDVPSMGTAFNGAGIITGTMYVNRTSIRALSGWDKPSPQTSAFEQLALSASDSHAGLVHPWTGPLTSLLMSVAAKRFTSRNR